MYRVHLINGGHLQVASSNTFDFGTGDFAVTAMISSSVGGTAVARKDTSGGAEQGGFLLFVNPDGSVKFTTFNGSTSGSRHSYYQVVSGPSKILDLDSHTIAGIRTGTQLSILIDGIEVPVTASGDGTSPMNVDNSLPVTIGCTGQNQDKRSQFVGSLMNISIWNTALSGDLLVSAAFGSITGKELNLQGYWALNNNTIDLSLNNSPADIVGEVSFEYCMPCKWVEGANDYTFCGITNEPDDNTPEATLNTSREINIQAGTPSFGMSIMANQDVPAFPDGAQVQLTDPQGNIYNQDTNTKDVFVSTSSSQPWSVMIMNPMPGIWQLNINVSSTVGFHLVAQTTPSTDVVLTCERTLAPLFSNHRRWGVWDTVASVAVAVLVGAVVAGAVILSGGTLVPALIAGGAAFAGVSNVAMFAATEGWSPTSLLVGTGQAGGMAGFWVAAGSLLLMDANVPSDKATQRIYKQRQRHLYPEITKSTFNKVQIKLIGDEMTHSNVSTQMSSFTTGYVSGSGHGSYTSLYGYYASGDTGALQEVLQTYGKNAFTQQQVTGKIIHLFACSCGSPGSTTSHGLGRAMVSAGAIAFFGYKEPVIIYPSQQPAFCKGDIEIDLAMIRGETCKTAYNNAIAVYNGSINRLRADCFYREAAALEHNRDSLVAPSTDEMYGNEAGKLIIKSDWIQNEIVSTQGALTIETTERNKENA